MFDSRVIFGDNLLAQEQGLTGKIKCVCIDPSYNTGSAFTHHDGAEYSLWLSLMRERADGERTGAPPLASDPA